jgi:hypothetical protein
LTCARRQSRNDTVISPATTRSLNSALNCTLQVYAGDDGGLSSLREGGRETERMTGRIEEHEKDIRYELRPSPHGPQ